VQFLRSIILFIALSFAVTACARGPLPSAETVGQQRELGEYRLGAGDKLRVTVFGEEQLTGEYSVGSNGVLSMPLIGGVQAGGLTLGEFANAVQESLAKGFLQNPRVSVEVLNFRPFYILGEVNNPGEYPYTANLTVLNAVARAGGYTYRANTRKVYIKRADEPNEQEYALSASTMVAPGDTIRIGERFF
jgi:protein involved in polysaccharide export with SLBB domain